MAVDNLSLDYRTILPILGNPRVGNRVGLGVALSTVLASLRQGKNAANVQFDTIRKTQTWYANAYDAGDRGELLLRDGGRLGPEEAVSLDWPYVRKVVLALHERSPIANGNGPEAK